MVRKPAYVTLKYHKENFIINPKCPLINPAKNELGKVAKIIVENINKTDIEKLHCNWWRNTSNVIDWFQNIADKVNCIFIQFNIEEFYPLITKHLMLKVIEHAQLYTSITQQQLDIILHTRQSLLFSKDKPCEKTINKSLFDITMGSYDGAEICELVGLYILSILGEVYGIQNVGLYWNDGLACLHKTSGPTSNRIGNDITRTFQENFGLKITITTNLKIVNFLDVTFDLCTGRSQPHKKPNDPPTYINGDSNHTPNIIKAYSIWKRIRKISFNKATFNNATPFYNNALFASGYKENLTYQNDLPPSNKVRQRKIIWFNPTYSLSVETNIGKTFLKLIEKHFPKTNTFHKIFNRNNVSYSCLPNFANMIKSSNNRILSEEKTQDQPKCNCQQKDTYPIEGNCIEKELIYQCNLKENSTSDGVNYSGLTKNTF